MVIKRKRKEYSPEDWNINPWPEPKPGQKYGPTPMQEQLFIYHPEPWERPHFHGVDIVLMVGGRGSGKSWKRGTRVLLQSGKTKKVEDIVVGDKLIGPDSTPRTVLSLGRGRETFYKVSPVKGEPFYCNESHILALKRTGNQAKEYRTRADGSIYTKPPRYGGDTYVNVSIKEYLTWTQRKQKSYVLYRSGEVTFPSSYTPPLDPYLLGVWLGDGHSGTPSITSMDPEIVQALYDYVADKPHLFIRVQDTPNNRASTYHVSSGNTGRQTKNDLLEALRSLDLVGNKHIPHLYKTLPVPERLQLLAGLIDTDGHYQNRGHFEIVQKNKGIAEDIAFLCRSVGLAAYLSEVRKYCWYRGEKKEGTYYQVHISGDLDKIPTRLPRKQATPRQQVKNVLVTGFSLEKLPKDDYYGFTVDGDHLFLLGDFTVVHNSLACIAEIIELVATYPKCAAVVGGVDMPLLKRNVMDLFGERLSWVDGDGIPQPWEHPLVLKPPPEKTPVAPMINGATIRFLNIGDALKVRGFTADIFMIEEVNLLEGSSLKEMFGRSRGRALPIRQFILNMNPTGTRDWVYDMFALKQFEKTYEGPSLQIGDICKCEFCEICMAQELGEFMWEGGEKKIGPNGAFYEWTGGVCPNPECANIAATTLKDRAGNITKMGSRAKKDSLCPGAQSYYRVIRSASFDNPHNPSDFVQLQKGAMSKEEFETYVKGEIVDLNTGFIYKEFSSANIAEVEFDPEKDMYWTMDFNKDPMCSQVVQDNGDVFQVVDEFTLWNADERKVAQAFCERYKGYKGTVRLHGDPNGITTSSRADSTKVSFKFLYDYLRKEGFKAEMGVRKIKGDTIIPIPDRINTLKAALKTVDGTSRIIISPKCINLIESLRHTKWDERKKTPHEDENCDANAKLNPRRYEQAVLMTHPQAALGYLVVREKKFLLEKTGVKVIMTEESTVISDANSTTKTEKRQDVPLPLPPKVELPEEFKLSSHFGFAGSPILRERMEYERLQAEEYKRRREG